MAFYPLEQLSKLHDGYKKSFKVAGKSLLLVQSEGQAFVIENRCPHMDVPLDNAQLIDANSIRCRAHGIEFDLPSGKPKGPLADMINCLNKFSISYDGATLGVEIPEC